MSKVGSKVENEWEKNENQIVRAMGFAFAILYHGLEKHNNFPGVWISNFFHLKSSNLS